MTFDLTNAETSQILDVYRAAGPSEPSPIAMAFAVEKILRSRALAWVERLREEAELARRSPDGQHPKIDVMTHAAALRFAADMIEREV